MTDTSTITEDRAYFATQFAHVEWMVYTRGRLPFVLVDNVGRELDGQTARRIAVDYEGTAFHYGEPIEDENEDLGEQVAVPAEPEATPAVTS